MSYTLQTMYDYACCSQATLELNLYRCATPSQEERPVAVKHPSVEELARIAQAYHLSPTRQDLESFSALMTSTLLSYARLDQLTEPTRSEERRVGKECRSR